MAEKKFFVDINLQGSALYNATIGSNSSLTKAGSFGFDGTRLQYFDGSAIKEVANLSDISAVTGGLILQGGYDADTNSPNIVDGTALKGFFWVVTVAGSFLGESVQIGDSIIAKVDEADDTLSDWLILQGNVVIATDSVDGISRLATQTEANDGTEGGAVVITPATLQGKIDAQITPEISSKLPLAGGTMSGTLAMGNNTIDDVNNIRINAAPISGKDATNKSYVDDADALKLDLAGGTMSGAINMNNHYIDGVSNINVGIVNADFLNSNTVVDPIQVASDLNLNNGRTIKGLPAPAHGGDATNKTYVDDNTSNKLPLAGGTMSGNINMDGRSVQNGSITNMSDVSTRNIRHNDSESNVTVKTDLTFENNYKIIDLAAPTDNGDATNKEYVDTTASTAQANAETTASADATAKVEVEEARAKYEEQKIANELNLAVNGLSNDIAKALDDANTYTDTAINNNSGRITLPSGSWVDSGNGDYIQIVDVSAYTQDSYPPITQIVSATGEVIELSTSMENIGLLRVACNVPGNGFDWTILVTKAS